MLAQTAVGALPAGYRQCEYIQCGADCWIDTGISATDTTVFESELAAGVNGNIYGLFHAGPLSPSEPAAKWGQYMWSGGGKYHTVICRASGGAGANAAFGESDADYHQWGIDAANGLCWKDAAVKELDFVGGGVPDASHKFELGRYSANYPLAKVGRTTIRSGGAVVFDGVPCYRSADGEIGMYDHVSGRFLTNAGTGTMTKGEDV